MILLDNYLSEVIVKSCVEHSDKNVEEGKKKTFTKDLSDILLSIFDILNNLFCPGTFLYP